MSVTTYLMGGVGNQAVQMAAGISLARQLGVDLNLDISRFDNPNEFRMYSLGLFKGVTQTTVHGLSGKVIREQGMPYNPGLFIDAPRECSIFGYWQTERYFAHLKNELRKIFQPKQPLPPFHAEMERRIAAEGRRSAFLTVRRTDYVGNDFHGLLPMEYYRKAAELVASQVDDPCFFIFSDEPEWCRANFRLPYRMVVAGNFDRTTNAHLGREDAELWLMQRCRHAVCANSSYSWWGAWLGDSDAGGIVVAPERWFGPASGEDPRDIVPERWVKI